MIPFRRPSREASMPDITPLLDVVFILLIFFIIGSAFAIHGMDMDLPESRAANAYAGQAVEVVLAEDGSLLYDDQPVTREDLAVLLDRAMEPLPGSGTPQILLKVSSEVSVGVFMRTVDVIRNNGGERLVIATRPPHSPDDPS